MLNVCVCVTITFIARRVQRFSNSKRRTIRDTILILFCRNTHSLFVYSLITRFFKSIFCGGFTRIKPHFLLIRFKRKIAVSFACNEICCSVHTAIQRVEIKSIAPVSYSKCDPSKHAGITTDHEKRKQRTKRNPPPLTSEQRHKDASKIKHHSLPVGCQNEQLVRGPCPSRGTRLKEEQIHVRFLDIP